MILRHLPAVLIVSLAVGCSSPPEPAADAPAAPADEPILQLLDPYDAMYKVNSEGRTIVLAMIPGTLVGIVAIIGSTINRIHRRNVDAAMKQDMLDRGLSADDIERVLAAKSPEPHNRRCPSVL